MLSEDNRSVMRMKPYRKIIDHDGDDENERIYVALR